VEIGGEFLDVIQRQFPLSPLVEHFGHDRLRAENGHEIVLP